MNNNLLAKKQKTHSITMILLLILSFAWISLFSSFNFSTFDFLYGNIFDPNSNISSIAMTNVLSYTFLNWISFELICYLYRFILSFKIYSFVVPHRMLANECRKYFIYRNIIYGIFTNMCFLYPYLYIFSGLVNLVVTMIIVIYFALYISKKYSETIIGHFVFKCFCYPVVIYEAIGIIFQIWGTLS